MCGADKGNNPGLRFWGGWMHKWGPHLRSRTRVPSEDEILCQTANGNPEKCIKILLEYSIWCLFFTKPHFKMKTLLCKERQKCQEYSGVWNNLTCVTGICQVWHERRREEVPLQVLPGVIIFLSRTYFRIFPGNAATTYPHCTGRQSFALHQALL